MNILKALNFEYDGILASDYGFLPCSFNNESIQTIDYGSKINFDIVSIQNGKTFALVNSSYEEANEFTFQICKNYCHNEENYYFTTEEQRFIYRWLNRNDGFHKLKIFEKDFGVIIFDGSFNISAIELDGKVIGFELTFTMGKPFATQECRKITHEFLSNNDELNIVDFSDNIGYIYPELKITCKSDGDLKIYNSIENRMTVIKNCKSGEVITFDENLNIQTSLSSHKIYNDFNFIFFRIANTYLNKKNLITVNIPCEITIEYYPIVKGVGL